MSRTQFRSHGQRDDAGIGSEDGAALGWEQVLHLADLALYAAKKGGRNRSLGHPPC